MRRLFPEPGAVSAQEAVADLAGRDVLALNMVSSVDGRATLEGLSGALSAPGDRELFHALRAHADAILVGTRTLRDEGYGRFTKDERRRAMRRAAGLADAPLGATITRHGLVPWEIGLFTETEERVIVYSGVPVTPPPSVTADVEVVRTCDPPAVVADLRGPDVRAILCEGGPTLNAALLDAGLVDELFITLAAALAGGDPQTIVAPPGAHVSLELRSALEDASALFLRYAIARAG